MIIATHSQRSSGSRRTNQPAPTRPSPPPLTPPTLPELGEGPCVEGCRPLPALLPEKLLLLLLVGGRVPEAQGSLVLWCGSWAELVLVLGPLMEGEGAAAEEWVGRALSGMGWTMDG